MQIYESIPDKPGVYLMKDISGKIIYIGKAASLQDRVRSYFRENARHSPKVAAMVRSIASIDYHLTPGELEALILESSLIKKYRPKYNIELKDDKSYPYIKLTLNETWPRILLTRRILPDGARYFGPYVAGSVRRIIKVLTGRFHIRDCNIDLGKAPGRPCLKYQLGICAGPCAGNVSPEKYTEITENVKKILEGRQQRIKSELKEKMEKASKILDFETAAELRDRLHLMDLLSQQAEHKLELTGIAKAESRQQILRKAILELKNRMKIDRELRRIEAFDISTMAGESAVGSLVVFQDGYPEKKSYRHFKIKRTSGQDDFAMLFEIVERTYRRRLDESGVLPDLILADGGKGQLNSVKTVLKRLGLDYLPVAGIAKKNEEIFLPAQSVPLVLPKDSAALHLIQHIRDEAHRFALKYHVILERKRLAVSCLDRIPGIGSKKKTALLRHFQSIDSIRSASVEKLVKVPGITASLAEKIKSCVTVIKQ